MQQALEKDKERLKNDKKSWGFVKEGEEAMQIPEKERIAASSFEEQENFIGGSLPYRWDSQFASDTKRYFQQAWFCILGNSRWHCQTNHSSSWRRGSLPIRRCIREICPREGQCLGIGRKGSSGCGKRTFEKSRAYVRLDKRDLHALSHRVWKWKQCRRDCLP